MAGTLNYSGEMEDHMEIERGRVKGILCHIRHKGVERLGVPGVDNDPSTRNVTLNIETVGRFRGNVFPKTDVPCMCVAARSGQERAVTERNRKMNCFLSTAYTEFRTVNKCVYTKLYSILSITVICSY